VLKDFGAKACGQIIDASCCDAGDCTRKPIYLHAQVPVIGFYEHGFAAWWVFDEAGILIEK